MPLTVRTGEGISECRLSTLTKLADALQVDVKEILERQASISRKHMLGDGNAADSTFL